MSVRNLDALFRPKSVALIGASTRPHAIGALVAGNLLRSGFNGAMLPVNPHAEEIGGVRAYRDVASLPVVPDLAIICTPPDSVPPLIAELGRLGTRGAIVITAGFGELGSERGRLLEQQMLAVAKPTLMRIVGPNCLGVISTPVRLDASFAHIEAKKGQVAFVAQSGAMVTTVLDWATARGLGFSCLVSLGDMADVDFGDMLDYLASDPDTAAILLYVESITQARKFMSAARAAARLKPVIALKAGRHPASARAAASHTGALAGMDAVYDAAFRRAGILRVFDLDEVFDAVETLARRPRLRSESLIILTNGGGVGVLATDALVEQGGQLAQLSAETITELDAVLPPTWSRGNPVDIIGDADGERYARALECLGKTPGRESLLVLNCPTAVASSTDAARVVVDAAKSADRAIFTSWLGQTAPEEAREIFAAAGIPTYETPEKAVRGFMHAVRYARGQAILLEVPPSIPANFNPDDAAGRTIIREALDAGETWLSQPRLWKLLDCYGIPTPRWIVARTEQEAADAGDALGVPVALKIVSPDILHKSDVDGVALNLVGRDAIAAAAAAMRTRVLAKRPGARVDGFFVQEMVRRPDAFELILGAGTDATFGPFLLFGQGGTAVEIIDDKALALPPLNLALANELMSHTRVWRQLQGYRNRPPAALDDAALTLVRLSQLICDLGEVAEVDINPLLADVSGVIALDARVRIAPNPAGDRRLAIRPYPKELERHESVSGIGELFLRPVKPEDASAFNRFFEQLAPEDVRLRFFTPLRALPERLRARFTQIDYDREMAFVLFRGAEIIGVTRLAADPDNVKAEFAVIVRSDLKGKGLGRMLLDRIIQYARQRGIGEIFGDILPENTAMLNLCRDLGCRLIFRESGVVRARLSIAETEK